MKTKYFFILIFTLFIFQQTASSQTTVCDEYLIKGRQMYDFGNYAEAVRLLELGMEQCSYSSVEKQQLRKILSAAYYELDEIEKADSLMYKFLKKNPTYMLEQTTDPVPFMDAYRNYLITPRIGVGISVATNNYKVEMLKKYSVWQSLDYQKAYVPQNSIGGALNFDFRVTTRFWLGLGAEVNTMGYIRTLPGENDLVINMNENFISLRVPVYSQFYVLNRQRLKVSLTAGIYAYQIQKAEIHVSGSYFSTVNAVSQEFNLPDLDIKPPSESRNSEIVGTNLGIRVYYSFDRFKLIAQYRKDNDFIPYIIAKNSGYLNTDRIGFILADNDIIFSNNFMSIGIYYDLLFKVKHKYRK